MLKMGSENGENFNIIVLIFATFKWNLFIKFTGFMVKNVSIVGTQFAKSQNLKFHNFGSTKVIDLKFHQILLTKCLSLS